jgi:hypothetical protein
MRDARYVTGGEPGRVVADQGQQEADVGVAGAEDGGEHLALAGAGGGFEDADGEPRVLEQDANDGLAGGLDSQGDGPASAALVQGSEPVVQRLGRGVQGAVVDATGAVLHGKGVMAATAVQADPGLERDGLGAGGR